MRVHILIAGYFLESMIILIWYFLVIKKELHGEKIFWRIKKLVKKVGKNIITRILWQCELTEEQEKALEKIFGNIHSLMFDMLWGGCYFFVCPWVIAAMSTVCDNTVVTESFFILIMVAVWMKELQGKTQAFIIDTNTFIKNVMLPLEHDPSLIEIGKDQRVHRNITKKNCVVVVVCILIVAFLVIIIDHFKNHKGLQIVGCLVLIVSFIVDKLRNREKEKKEIESGIHIEGYELESVKNEIEEMCTKLKIGTISVKILNVNEANASATIDENGMPEISITYGFFQIIINRHWSAAKDILLIALGHEMGHIRNNDRVNIVRRQKGTFLICFLGYIAIFLMLYGAIYYRVFLLFAITILIAEYIFGNVMTDIRYWEQIAELKADRLALQLHEDGMDEFLEFWKTEFLERSIEKENLLYKYYKRYIENEAHPSLQRRIELLKNRHRWHKWEYFEHALLIRKWQLTNRGWNGR